MTEQIFYPHFVWEDWLAGMWQTPDKVTSEVQLAAHILSSPELFYHAALVMLNDWPNSAEHNLTNLRQNRYSWVGQATCCHLARVSESATRQAWWTLTTTEQVVANQTADRAVIEWERNRAQD